MSLETLFIAKPDTIFVYGDGGSHSFETNPTWRYLSTVHRARIVRVGGHWIESFGPIARHAVLAEAAAHLHPERFSPPSLRAIASLYLGQTS